MVNPTFNNQSKDKLMSPKINIPEISEKELKKLLVIEEIIKLEQIKASKKEVEEELLVIKEQYKDQNLTDDENLKLIVSNNIKRRKSIQQLIKIAKSSTNNRKK